MYKRPTIKSPNGPTKIYVPPWVAKINELIANGKLAPHAIDHKGRKVYRLKNEGP
jgi:hypothetical protein